MAGSILLVLALGLVQGIYGNQKEKAANKHNCFKLILKRAMGLKLIALFEFPTRHCERSVAIPNMLLVNFCYRDCHFVPRSQLDK
jgi:hypothetical protein